MLVCALRNASTVLIPVKCSENSFNGQGMYGNRCVFFSFAFEYNLFVVNVFVNFCSENSYTEVL